MQVPAPLPHHSLSPCEGRGGRGLPPAEEHLSSAASEHDSVLVSGNMYRLLGKPQTELLTGAFSQERAELELEETAPCWPSSFTVHLIQCKDFKYTVE